MRSNKRWLGAILLVSVVVRLAASIVVGDEVVVLPGIADQISYHTLALRLLGGYGFTFGQQWWPITAAGTPTAHWSYLYTLYLFVVYGVFGAHPLAARLIQSLVAGVLMPWLTYRLARRVVPWTTTEPDQPHWPALVAAAWSALYIYFIYYTAALMTEAFFMVGVLWSLDCTLRLADRRLATGETTRPAVGWLTWAELGLALAITTYLRQTMLLVVPALLVWLALLEILAAGGSLGARLGAAWRNLAGGVIAAMAVLFLLIAPATVFNYRQFHRFVLLNTNAGYAFFWANHPIYGDHFVAILPNNIPYTDLIPADLRSLNTNEAALESALMQRGVGFVLADPARYIRLSISRIPVYFLFWPTSDSGFLSNAARVASFGLALPFMLAGLALWAADWRRAGGRGFAARGSLLVLFCAVYSLIHLLSWALTRYRLPVDAVGLIFAGRALVSGGRRVLRLSRPGAA